MRITFVLPSADLSGGGRVVAVYAERLRRRGHDVTVVYPGPRQIALARKISSLIRGRGWSPRKLQGPSHLDNCDIRQHVVNPWRPIRASDVPDADLIIATWWETAEWISSFPPSKGKQVHFIQHDESLWLPQDPLWVKRVHASWRLPGRKITISQWLVDLIFQRTGINEVDLVHNSVDTEQFFAHPRPMQIRPTVGLLYATNLFKGVDVSLNALKLVKRAVPNLKLLAFGTANPVAALPFPDETEFHRAPDQNKIRNLYASCDVWVCGSRSEGFHLPPLEAMACRCPVVSTKVGGSVDVIKDGVNGFLVEVEDATALAERVNHTLRQGSHSWQRMSAAAHATAHSYSWEDATIKFETALQSILNPHSIPSPVEAEYVS